MDELTCRCGSGCGCPDMSDVQLFHLYEVKLDRDGTITTEVLPVRCERTAQQEIESDIKLFLPKNVKVLSYKRFDPNNSGNIDN